MASGAIKVYVYDRILALFSAVPYASPSRSGDDTVEIDLSAHLTNTSLQTERGEAGVRLLNELVGCHVLSSSSQPRRQQPKPRHAMGQAMDVDSINARRAEATKYSTVSAEDVSDIKGQICEVLSETFKAAVEMSVHFQVSHHVK